MPAIKYRSDWESAGHVKLIVDTLNDGTSPNSEGGITFVDHDFEEYFFLLADCLTYDPELLRSEISKLAYRSFIDLRKNGPVKASDLLREANSRASELLRAPRKTFTMWTKLRLTQVSQAPTFRLKIGSVSLRSAARLANWMRLEEYFISGVGRIHPTDPANYGFLICSATARNEDQAARQIYDACDLFYAAANLSSRPIELWIQRQAQAALWYGPYQFFFENKRFLGKNRIWYNADYDEERWERFPLSARTFQGRIGRCRELLGRLGRHPLETVLAKVMVLISEGMISPDLSYRLLRYWSAFETLYGDPNGQTSTERLIRRAVFALDDKTLTILKLRRLSELRNEFVHAGSRDDDDNHLVQFLRELICSHLFYLLTIGDDFASHEDFLVVTDLPGDAAALAARKLAIDRREAILLHKRHRALAKGKR